MQPGFSGCLQPVIGSGELPKFGFQRWSGTNIPPGTTLLAYGIFRQLWHCLFPTIPLFPFLGAPAVCLCPQLGRVIAGYSQGVVRSGLRGY